MKKLFKSPVLSGCLLATLFALTAFSFIGCSNGSSDDSSGKGGQLIEAKFISKESFDDIINEPNKRNDAVAIAELKKRKQTMFDNFKTEVKRKSAASGVTFKCKDGKPNVTLRSAAEVDAYFTENNLGIDVFCPYVATYNITYSTTSANGELIQASARVLVNYGEMTFPWDDRWYAETDRIGIHCHVTQMQNSEIPTSQSGKGASEYGLLYFEAWNDNMIVSPDYEGYGNTKDRVHPYLIQEATAKQCYDAVCAAKYWKETGKDSDGYSLGGLESNFYTASFGFSQGGSVALATQNYIEKNDTKLNFKGSLCGDGPYDPFATYSRYADDSYGLHLPSVIVLILRAYLYYYKDSYLKGFSVEDYLKPEVIQGLKDNDPAGQGNVWGMIDSKTKSTTDVDGVIKKAVGVSGTVKASDMLTDTARDESSDAYKALKKALDANSMADPAKWIGGKNKKPIRAVHYQCDEVVPFKNYESLTANGFDVTDKTVRDPGITKALYNILSSLGLSGGYVDMLKDAATLFEHEQSKTIYDGAHCEAGVIFYVGNITLPLPDYYFDE